MCRSGEAGLAPQAQPAPHQASYQHQNQHHQPAAVHSDLRQTRMDPEPDEDAHSSRDDRVVPPAALFAGSEFAAGLGGKNGVIVEAVAVTLALNGEVPRVVLTLACNGGG